MNINATLIGQIITFVIFMVIAMKWIWPLFKKILDERAKKIADGLAASRQGHRDLEIAEHKVQEMIDAAKQRAVKIVEDASARAHAMIDAAQNQARLEAEHILQHARNDVQQEIHTARENLRRDVARLAVLGAEKILQREINVKDSEKLLADVGVQL